MTNAFDYTSSPRVFIGLPVYNGGHLIRESLTSLMNQTYKNIVIFVSDNHSNDQTAEVILELQKADPRIKYFRQQSNIGSSSNFKFVFDKAEGDYFMWCGHDDVWHPEFIQKVLGRMLESQAKLGFCNFEAINPQGTSLHAFQFLRFDGNSALRKWNYLREPEHWGKANLFCGIFELNFLRNLSSRFFEDFSHIPAHDCILIYGVVLNGSIAIVPEFLFKKRTATKQKNFAQEIALVTTYRGVRPSEYLLLQQGYLRMMLKNKFSFSSGLAIFINVLQYFSVKILDKVYFWHVDNIRQKNP